MFIGFLILGSIAGLVAAGVAWIAGQSLLTITAAYFGAALLTVAGVILICAIKHRLQRIAVQKAKGAANLPRLKAF